MDSLILARLQFAITTVYHFLFVPLTLGLSLLVAYLQTRAYQTGDPTYRSLTRFWGRLFLINFAIGVGTGIVQEFQFGMNWSEYSRFVGDIFGAPLAIEALLAFFMESTFLGIWIFGEGKISPKLHALSIWLVAIGSNISAIWILIANSFMQNPVGFALRNGRAEMTDFFALITNPNVLLQYPHVFFGGLITAGFFVAGISAWHLSRHHTSSDTQKPFLISLRLGLILGLAGTLGSAHTGHLHAKALHKRQPMKLAAAEALYETSDPASFSLFSLIDEENRRESFSVRVPYVLSFLIYNRPEGPVKGLNDLQKEYEDRFGPGNYIPPVTVNFWSFRIMVGIGFALLLIAAAGLWFLIRRKAIPRWLLVLITWSIPLPWIANSSGWILAEIGRQPWVVFGVMRTENAVSPGVGAFSVLFSLSAFTALYGVLCILALQLFYKHAKAGITPADLTAQAHH